MENYMFILIGILVFKIIFWTAFCCFRHHRRQEVVLIVREGHHDQSVIVRHEVPPDTRDYPPMSPITSSACDLKAPRGHPPYGQAAPSYMPRQAGNDHHRPGGHFNVPL